ncbi:MAG: methyl-accepting chemotaxis protein [Simplicispira sp.]|nr:methyl-accepting chemotaxis protein [Simplicispira sp.]
MPIIVGALLAFAFGSALAWWLVRDTRAAVREAVEATRRMAQHDLSQPIDTRRQDEIGGLLAALKPCARTCWSWPPGCARRRTTSTTPTAKLPRAART